LSSSDIFIQISLEVADGHPGTQAYGKGPLAME